MVDMDSSQRIKFTLHILDTQYNLLLRIAAAKGTLVKYLYFPGGIPTIEDFRDQNEIIVEDLFDVIIREEYFLPLFEKIKSKLDQQDLNLKTDILEPFIVFNKIFQKNTQMAQHLLLLLKMDIDNDNLFESSPDIYEIWNNKDKIKDAIQEIIKKEREKSRKVLENSEKLERVKTSWVFTDFELDNTDFEVIFNTNVISLTELFNQIQLIPEVPFASVREFYKIFKDFIPIEDWSVTLDEAIVLRISQRSKFLSSRIEDYTDAILQIQQDPQGKRVVRAEMNLDISDQNLSKEGLISRVFSVIPGTTMLSPITETSVNGVFYFPKKRINNYIISDLIMNDPLFSDYMYIDESHAATKKKQSLYIKCEFPLIGAITVNITEKIAKRGDFSLRGKDIKNIFPLGLPYIRVRVSRAKNVRAVEKFQDIFSKLLAIYSIKFPMLIKYYQKFIPNFESIKKINLIKQSKKLKLKDLAPEVFVTNYALKCLHHPIIITDEEASKTSLIVMKYPKEDDATANFPTRNYICPHKKHRFPGLRNNPLTNRDVVPFLPCCYEKNHSMKQGSIYRHYFFGDELRMGKTADQQELIRTNKFVMRNKYGKLPTNITKLLRIFDPDKQYMFVRKGVFDSKSSFLECVMEGLHEKTGILNLDDQNKRKSKLEELRRKLAQESWAASCKQEMYDFTTKEIIDAIKNPDVLFDPKFFVNLLETYFDCNIFIFTRKNPDGELSIPRHVQAYYNIPKKGKCILIYQHMGSKSDHATYPRCELIVKWRISDAEDVEYSMGYTSDIYKGVRQVFNKMTQSYALNHPILTADFPLREQVVKLTHQGIDSYGKSRMLRFTYNDNIGTILTAPMQPWALPEIQGWIATKLSSKIALEVAIKMGIKITSQQIIGDFTKAYQGKLGNMDVTIPIEDIIPGSLPDYQGTIGYPQSKISTLTNYNKYKKLARYIQEYMYWLYSKYLYKTGEEISLQSISQFANKYLLLDPEFKYTPIGKSFHMQSGAMKEDKLVVKSEEVKKRLLYSLRIFARRHRSTLLSYHTQTMINNYYVDITDFDHYQFQVILEGEYSVGKWINEQRSYSYLYDSIQIGKRNNPPYFFRNKLIDNQIWLAQNTFRYDKALQIARIWNRDGYNPGENPLIDDDLEINFILYSYVSSQKIEAYMVGDNVTRNDPKVVGFKVNENPFFTVLLPL